MYVCMYVCVYVCVPLSLFWKKTQVSTSAILERRLPTSRRCCALPMPEQEGRNVLDVSSTCSYVFSVNVAVAEAARGRY